MVSGLGLGALEVGRPWGIRGDGDLGQPPPLQEAEEFLNHILDAGVNFIDTAAAYWASEERIGSAISHRRDEYILATKWGEWCDENGSIYSYSPGEMWKFLESSLTKLRTDRIDLYQIHSAPLDVLERGDALAEMQKAKEQGKIRFIGCWRQSPAACSMPCRSATAYSTSRWKRMSFLERFRQMWESSSKMALGAVC